MSFPTKITFILKSPLVGHIVDEFNTDFDENVQIKAVIKQKFDGNIIIDTTPLIIWIVTTYSEGIVEALGEKTFELLFTKLNRFLNKYCEISKNKKSDIRIEVTEGEKKFQFEATNVTAQTVDNALSEFRSILLQKQEKK